jgi:hypothetical protein
VLRRWVALSRHTGFRLGEGVQMLSAFASSILFIRKLSDQAQDVILG